MKIEATNKSAFISGIVAGTVIMQVEFWSLSNRAEGFIMTLFFFCSVLFFTTGYQNIRIKTVFYWDNLTEGEKEAFFTRIPIWFFSFFVSAFLTNFLF